VTRRRVSAPNRRRADLWSRPEPSARRQRKVHAAGWRARRPLYHSPAIKWTRSRLWGACCVRGRASSGEQTLCPRLPAP
jgi:hypothetical protein